jgi:hypothetical protein
MLQSKRGRDARFFATCVFQKAPHVIRADAHCPVRFGVVVSNAIHCAAHLLVLLLVCKVAATSDARYHCDDNFIEARNTVARVARWKIVAFRPFSGIKNRTAWNVIFSRCRRFPSAKTAPRMLCKELRSLEFPHSHVFKAALWGSRALFRNLERRASSLSSSGELSNQQITCGGEPVAPSQLWGFRDGALRNAAVQMGKTSALGN